MKKIHLFIILSAVMTAVQLKASAFRDTEITIIVSGSWNGILQKSENGEGGIAALYSYAEKERLLSEAKNGSLLFLQNGNLFGDQSQVSAAQQLIRPEMNLLRYMKWDAVNLSKPELLNIIEESNKPEFRELRRAPLISFNLRPALVYRGNASEIPDKIFPVMPHHITEKKNHFFFITGITKSQGDDRFGDDSCSVMKNEFMRQTGIDLFIVMADKESVSSLDNCESELFNTPAENEDPVSLPWEKTYSDPTAHKTIFLLSESKGSGNKQYRTMRGTQVCVTDPYNVCTIRVTFRKKKIISVTTQSLRINHADEPSAWIAPDQTLMKIFH